MKRLTAFIVVVFIVSSGCRMCGSDYDYCMPAIVDGGVQNASPLYRAGSILNGMSGNYDRYFTDPDCADCNSNNSVNFFDYNDTEENIHANPNNTPETYDDPNSTSKGWQGKNTETNIGIPRNIPNGNDNNNGNKNKQKFDLESGTPLFEDLMKMPSPRPTNSPKNNTPNSNQNNNVDPDDFTLDNLRKLDPSINDPDVKEVKIIKIENTPLR